MAQTFTLTLDEGDEVSMTAAAGQELAIVAEEPDAIVVRAIPTAPETSGNLLLNPYFEQPVLNGIGWQTADFPGWQQQHGTFMISRRKDAETSPVPVTDAIEFDRDNSGGWVIGQSDEIWQRVGIAADFVTSISAGIYAIHHVYGGQMTLTLSGRSAANGLWDVLQSWTLRNPDGSYNLPMATKTERIWRPISLGVTNPIPFDLDALELRITGYMGNIGDGMKLSGAWITVS